MQRSVKAIMAGVLIAIPIALIGAWMAVGYATVKDIETPKYSVAEKKKGYEIRAYDKYIRAEVTLEGEYRDTLYSGFRQVADYIFGNNQARSSIAMTAPVIQERSEKIAMTAPVIQEKGGQARTYTVAFIMPSAYSMETLPLPVNEAIRLREVPPKRFAVLKFSGYATEKRAARKTKTLLDFLKRDGISARGEPIVAQYNPPWTPPFMRRNEIQVEIE